ncbi:pyridoxal-phosphate dependent enzyme, partial [Puniceicoccaceae bacterium K14]|nr:pyridoxal-phosphate dependent enzyme [Puniceicoccaceae bacterium K14]
MYPSLDDLFNEILKARQRVYELAEPTPLQKLDIGSELESLFVKREDLSPIHAYKWRGSYNRMRQLSDSELAKGVVCASAGNHAQGVALSARKLGTEATIYMPRSTPLMKQEAVRSLGGDAVTVLLRGDSYDAACQEALEVASAEGKTFIHAYDDLQVIAGQGTLADEIVMSGEGPFDRVYLQIGGGGMAAGVACWLRKYYPDIEIVGVEGVDQASMAAAVTKGLPVSLDYLDVFCDGTAVKKAGEVTHHFCQQLIDRFVTVTNEEVCAGIQLLWNKHRLIPEPAGAMGLAAWLKEREVGAKKKSLVIVCGANMDFGQLSWVVRHAGIGSARRKFYRFFIEERPGSLLDLLNDFPSNVNIIEFQHGLVGGKQAAPVIGIDAMPDKIESLEKRLTDQGVKFEDATGDEDVEFRIIHYDASLLKYPLFIRIEFPERAGALGEFLNDNCSQASIVYFNYGYTGERVGRALIGFDFETERVREKFRDSALNRSSVLRHATELSEET